MDKAKVIEWLNNTGGYDILAPQFFLDMGLDAELVERLSGAYSSDPELGKHRATRKDGKPGDVEGVAEFRMVDAVARLCGVEPCHSYHGRGTNFRMTVGRILEALK